MAQDSVLPPAFGDYDELKELGRGGFGVVYRARHRTLDRIVALKVLNSQATTDLSFADRFRREAATAARLDHPNIVTIHSFGDVNGQLFIDMRYVPGETLASLIARMAPMPLDRTVEILRQIADALDYAHAARVIHRDVKPGNVMVEANGRVTLTDFGLARPAVDSLVGAPNSLENDAGTWAYMAPEQFADQLPGPPADRYALGVMAYEMLTGELPFPGPSIASMVASILDGAPTSLQVHRTDLPETVDKAIREMLSRDPQSRPGRCRAFVDQITSASNGDLVVSALGTGDFRTIGEALLSARPGATIRVRPGRYREAIRVSRDVTLIAEGRPSEVVVVSHGAPAMTIVSGSPTVRGFDLRVQAARDETPAVRVTGGAPVLADCTVTSVYGPGLEVRGAGTNPTVLDCGFRNCKTGNGIIVCDQGTGTFERCKVASNTYAGFVVRESGDPVVRDCTFRNSLEGAGILVYAQGRGTFERCESTGNALAGFAVREGGDPVVRDCTFRDSREGAGVLVHMQGRGTFERCESTGNALAGFAVEGGGDPVVRDCAFRQGKQVGILVHKQGKGTFERCEAAGNGHHGIAVDESGDPVVRDCVFRDGKAGGILVHRRGKGKFERCEVSGNTHSGIVVDESGHPDVLSCTFRDSREGAGILVHRQGRGTFERCDAKMNAQAGIAVREGGDPVVRHCTFRDGKESGILVCENGRGLFEACEATGNAYAGIELREGGDPVVRGSRFTRNGWGTFIRADGLGTMTECTVTSNTNLDWLIEVGAGGVRRDNSPEAPR